MQHSPGEGLERERPNPRYGEYFVLETAAFKEARQRESQDEPSDWDVDW